MDKEGSLKVIVVGGGIGGLVLSVALLRKGLKVQVLERDVTAIRGEGKYRGPIQVQSNALAALEAIDAEMAQEVFLEGCITGDRINGLCDGVTGDWYVKFDTFNPAVSKGLPVTRVISRFVFQDILSRYVVKYGGEAALQNSKLVVGYKEETDKITGKTQVKAMLDDGSFVEGDMLIGADGIWSKIRKQLVGATDPNYSEYTCYTGIADFTPPDINTVGYRVFLGNGRYFVSSDVGDGKMQWYGFHKEPAGGTDPEGQRQGRLMQIFGDWTHMVTDLIMATPEEDILRRDIYDRAPIYPWAKGRVALVGDSAHAMQPNLGQGGCMAIEDSYQLAKLIGEQLELVGYDNSKMDVPSILQKYQNQRVIRAAVIHGMAGMAAKMASTYRAYFGEGLGPLEWISQYKIPHYGRVSGQLVMKLTMPLVLDWVLGGNVGAFKQADRFPYCMLEDKPDWMDKYSFKTFIENDDTLLRAADANWIIQNKQSNNQNSSDKFFMISEEGTTIGIDQNGNIDIVNGDQQGLAISLYFFKNGQDYFVRSDKTESGLYINSRPLQKGVTRLFPDDLFQIRDAQFCVKLQHISVEQNVMALSN